CIHAPIECQGTTLRIAHKRLRRIPRNRRAQPVKASICQKCSGKAVIWLPRALSLSGDAIEITVPVVRGGEPCKESLEFPIWIFFELDHGSGSKLRKAHTNIQN